MEWLSLLTVAIEYKDPFVNVRVAEICVGICSGGSLVLVTKQENVFQGLMHSANVAKIRDLLESVKTVNTSTADVHFERNLNQMLGEISPYLGK